MSAESRDPATAQHRRDSESVCETHLPHHVSGTSFFLSMQQVTVLDSRTPGDADLGKNKPTVSLLDIFSIDLEFMRAMLGVEA